MRGIGNDEVYLIHKDNYWTHYGCAICGWWERLDTDNPAITIDEHLIQEHHLLWPGSPYFQDRAEEDTPTGRFEWIQVQRVIR